jgi:RNA polymerase sigma factor for flagellar operon FliA
MIMKLKTATATAMAPVPLRSMTMSAAAAPSFTSRAGTSHRQTAPVKPMGVSGTLHARASAKVGTGSQHGSQQAAQQGSQQKARLARRDRVVLEHLPLVKAIAVRVHENLPVHVDMDDLVHAGILGLFDAASKYNPEKQVAFSSYAKHRIKGAILDSLRQLDWASRDMRRRHKQVEAATRDLAGTLQRNPTEAEVAEKLGMDPERWRGMMLDLRNVGLISASTRSNEYDDLPAPDFPCKPETHPDSICAREQLRGVLGEAMKVLPERYQKVVSLYYTAEMTMKEIGGILGINESRVSQIHKSALEKMQVVLTANGIRSAQAF